MMTLDHIAIGHLQRLLHRTQVRREKAFWRLCDASLTESETDILEARYHVRTAVNKRVQQLWDDAWDFVPSL